MGGKYMSCEKCAEAWDKGKVKILQVPEIGNGIFRVAACNEHFEMLKEIVAKGLKPTPKRRKPKKEDSNEKRMEDTANT